MACGCLYASILSPPKLPSLDYSAVTRTKLLHRSAVSFPSPSKLSALKCKAAGQTTPSPTVYQGIYGPWTVDSSDVREVHFSSFIFFYFLSNFCLLPVWDLRLRCML